MKQLILILLLLISQLAIAQKMPSDYFKEGERFVRTKEYDKALASFQYIVDNHPRNELYSKAFYNIGYIYRLQHLDTKAIDIFKVIIESDFNEKEAIGGSIMSDPFANFRHRACSSLSDIYYEKEQYDTALHYFTMADVTYPYLHFCGNAYAQNDITTALGYSDIYQKLNQSNKAIEKLLPLVLKNQYANNAKIIEALQPLLASKKDVKKKLDKAIDNIYSKKVKRKVRDETYKETIYYLKFLNAKIEIPDDFIKQDLTFEDMLNGKEIEKADIKKMIKKTDFYKMVKSL